MAGSDALKDYLRDHHAGARVAVDLLESMGSEHAGEPLGRFAIELMAEIEADRKVLENLLERAGGERLAGLKEGAAWVGQKMSLLKLRRHANDDLGTLESLETLALGIQGKRALWRALAEIAPGSDALVGTDFEALSARAEDQHARVEERRLDAVREVFRTGS